MSKSAFHFIHKTSLKPVPEGRIKKCSWEEQNLWEVNFFGVKIFGGSTKLLIWIILNQYILEFYLKTQFCSVKYFACGNWWRVFMSGPVLMYTCNEYKVWINIRKIRKMYIFKITMWKESVYLVGDVIILKYRGCIIIFFEMNLLIYLPFIVCI